MNVTENSAKPADRRSGSPADPLNSSDAYNGSRRMVAQVFISHASEAAAQAAAIAAALEQVGLRAWLAPRELRAGESWPSALIEAIDASRLMIVVVTAEAVASPHVEREVERAVARRIPLLPLRVGNTKLTGALEYLLSMTHWLDVAGDELLDHLPELCQRAGELVAHAAPAAGWTSPPWNPPFPRNACFVGRDQLIDDVHRALCGGRATALVQPQALVGLGGVGKTQTALEYAYRYAHEYKLVWWIRAEKPATLIDDLLALAVTLGIARADTAEPEEALARLRISLDERGRYLLILDNAPDPTSISQRLPPRQLGHILVTSRDIAWRDIAHTIAVPVLPRSDALRLLEDRSGSPADAAAEQLANALGDLPLALVQAAAYVEQHGCNFQEYVRLFRKYSSRVFADGQIPQSYSATVASTWALAFERVRTKRPTAAHLLDICSVLDPGQIPVSLFRQPGDGAATQFGTDELALNEDISILIRYSLLDRKGDYLSLHRLVQMVIRGELSARGALGEVVATAVQLLGAAFSFDPADVNRWPLGVAVLPHIVAVAEHGRANGYAAEATATLLYSAGQYQVQRGLPADARHLLEASLELRRQVFQSDDHEAVVDSLLALAGALGTQGDLLEARALEIQVIEIVRRLFSTEAHTKVAEAHAALGVTEWRLGHLQQAQAALERAISIARGLGDPAAERVLTIATHDLGVVFHEQGKLDEAETLLSEALARRHGHGDQDHREIAVILHELSRVILAHAEAARPPPSGSFYDPRHLAGFSPELLVRAEGLLLEALAMHRRVGTHEHPDALFSMHVLGRVLRGQGRIEEARTLLEHSIAIRTRVCGGVRHYTSAESMYELALIQGMTGDFTSAVATLQEVLSIEETAYGTRDHHSIAATERALAEALLPLGRTAEALSYLEHALATYENQLGVDHPRTERMRDRARTLLGSNASVESS